MLGERAAYSSADIPVIRFTSVGARDSCAPGDWGGVDDSSQKQRFKTTLEAATAAALEEAKIACRNIVR